MTAAAKPRRSGPSGKHKGPRRNLSASPQDFARWDARAEIEGMSWAELARSALNERVEKKIKNRP